MKKLAIVYDWLDSFGGAERILQIIFDYYSTSDIYTLFVDYNSATWAKKYQSRIKASFLQGYYNLFPFKKYFTPFMPSAIESFDLSGYEKVLSISSSFAKAVITRPETKHVCYLFCPSRFLWQENKNYLVSKYFLSKVFEHRIKDWLRRWDKVATNRPDEIYSLSDFSKNQIKNIYQKEVGVISPPFNFDYWTTISKSINNSKFRLEDKEYFLFVGRLEPYKRVDLLVSLFKQRKENLVIVGKGTEQKNLLKRAKGHENIYFFENVPDLELARIYKNAEALLMPQAEDFGFTALESLFFKTPVISYQQSGAAEIIKTSSNGCFFIEQSESSLEKVLNSFSKINHQIVVDWAKYQTNNFLLKLDHVLKV